MYKFKSVTSLLLATFFVVGCSSSNKDFEVLPTQELYAKGQTYLQEEDYSSAVRYLEEVNGRMRQNAYGEQTQLSLIYSYYKLADYTKALEAAEIFARRYPDSPNMDYVYYLAGLSNSRLSDNFIQDLFNLNPSRAINNVRNAYGNFQTLIQKYPESKYVDDATDRIDYLLDRLANHELSIVEFYMERKAYVAVANRAEEMLRFYPDSQRTYKALSHLKTALENMSLADSAAKVAELIEADKDKDFPKISKPDYPEQF